MAVVVFAEQRGEDVLKKLLQVPHFISLYQCCVSDSGLDPDSQKMTQKNRKQLINLIFELDVL
jgi:hypothetical protein